MFVQPIHEGQWRCNRREETVHYFDICSSNLSTKANKDVIEKKRQFIILIYVRQIYLWRPDEDVREEKKQFTILIYVCPTYPQRPDEDVKEKKRLDKGRRNTWKFGLTSCIFLDVLSERMALGSRTGDVCFLVIGFFGGEEVRDELEDWWNRWCGRSRVLWTCQLWSHRGLSRQSRGYRGRYLLETRTGERCMEANIFKNESILMEVWVAEERGLKKQYVQHVWTCNVIWHLQIPAPRPSTWPWCKAYHLCARQHQRTCIDQRIT